MDVKQFVERGYVPYENSVHYGTHPDGSTFSVSHTLEYCFSAYAVAQWAKALGYGWLQPFDGIIKRWEKLFDDSLKLVRPRVPNGEFIDNFNPLESWRGFQEGNAVQYTFFVPQHPYRLIEKVGKEEVNNRLDSIFTEARKSIFWWR